MTCHLPIQLNMKIYIKRFQVLSLSFYNMNCICLLWALISARHIISRIATDMCLTSAMETRGQFSVLLSASYIGYTSGSGRANALSTWVTRRREVAVTEMFDNVHMGTRHIYTWIISRINVRVFKDWLKNIISVFFHRIPIRSYRCQRESFYLSPVTSSSHNLRHVSRESSVRPVAAISEVNQLHWCIINDRQMHCWIVRSSEYKQLNLSWQIFTF